ncbi:MAG: hypothetical protein ACJASM_000903 [Salibacteraceae bacterium]|jgi:hypothetical protein
MKNLILVCIVLVFSVLSMNAQTIAGKYMYIDANISGENPNTFVELGVQGNDLLPFLNNGADKDDYQQGNAECHVKTWGGGSFIPIGASLANPLGGNFPAFRTGSGSALQWEGFGGVYIYNITQHVKANFPNIIDQEGTFEIRVHVQYGTEGTVFNKHSIIEWRLRVYTDYNYGVEDVEICEGGTVNLSSQIQSTYNFSPGTTIAVDTSTCTTGALLSGSLYDVGMINNSVVDSCQVGFVVQNTYGINANPASSGCWHVYNNTLMNNLPPNYLTSPSGVEYYGWQNFVVPCIDSAIITVSNNPEIVLSAFPQPVYNGAGSQTLILDNYVNIAYEDSYIMTGGNIVWTGVGGNYEFNTNVTQGIHNITIVATRGVCTKSQGTSLFVTNWPGVPASAVLDWMPSFDEPSDSAWIQTSGSPAPCYSTGVYNDCNYFQRHKWLCGNRVVTGTASDTLKLFIDNPQVGFFYEWKRSIDGVEQNLGFGVTKEILRRTNPLANTGATYSEVISFRAINTVLLASPWEYVVLEYPVYWYPSGATALDMESVGVKLEQYDCHDGSINTGYSTASFNTDSVYANGLLTGSWNMGLTGFISGYPNNAYSKVEANGSVYNDGDSWNNVWNGTKIQGDSTFESAFIKRAAPNIYEFIDWCDCDTRVRVVESVKNPEFLSITVPNDTVALQSLMTFDAIVDWGGESIWYVDSNTALNPYIGNNVQFYSAGNQGWHSVYNIATDVYGCYVDSLVSNAFYLNGIVIDSIPVGDTTIYDPIDPNVPGITAEFGGNLIVTPNNDGNNDNVNILDLGVNEYDFVLYNRWGQMIREISNEGSVIYMNDIPNATYFYRLIVNGNTVGGFIEIKI